MDLSQFNRIKNDFNRIPLVREVFADRDGAYCGILENR